MLVNENWLRMKIKDEPDGLDCEAGARVTDLELMLAELLMNSGTLVDAPAKAQRFGKWYSTNIGIGKDHSVTICIDGDSLAALSSRSGASFDLRAGCKSS